MQLEYVTWMTCMHLDTPFRKNLHLRWCSNVLRSQYFTTCMRKYISEHPCGPPFVNCFPMNVAAIARSSAWVLVLVWLGNFTRSFPRYKLFSYGWRAEFHMSAGFIFGVITLSLHVLSTLLSILFYVNHRILMWRILKMAEVCTCRWTV